MWSTLRVLLGSNKESDSNVRELNINGITASNDSDIANAFNDFFCNIGEALSRNFDVTQSDPTSSLADRTRLFNFEPISEEILMSVVRSMNNTGPGYDNLPMFIYKDYLSQLATVTTRLCNLSMLNGKFPDCLSVAKVKCIFKGGNPKEASNYRPISLLPCFGKILEKVVGNQLNDYLEENDLLSSKQFGFRKGRSTEHAVHTLVRDVHTNLNLNKYVMGVFLDIKKAFDSLDRNLLLIKLRFCGICNTEWNWFASYLCNRKQYTTYNNVSSSIKTVNFGVPQGGVISPLLFLVFYK